MSIQITHVAILCLFPEMEFWTHPDDITECGSLTVPCEPIIDVPPVNPVPLPAALWLFVTACVALVIARRRA